MLKNSKILILEGELILTYTWNNSGHNICGHIFEVIDYFHILKDHFDTRILFIGLIKEDFEVVLKKYNFTEEELHFIISKTLFHKYYPSIIKCNNILFTDGDIITMKHITFLCNAVLLFACGNKEIKNNTNKKFYILQDDRVYNNVHTNGINYKKKLLLDRLIVPEKSNNILMYLTKNCRLYDIDKVRNYIYNNSNVIILTDTDIYDKFKDINNCKVIQTPYDEFMNIKKYVYTPVSRHWDCSPRLIVECKYFDIEVEYIDIDYLEDDLGLYYRIQDIKNDFESLKLKKDDDIINILKEIF